MARIRPRYQYHLHGTLVAYILVTLLIAAGAFNSNNNLLFFLFGLAISLLLLGGLHSGFVLMRLRAERLSIVAESRLSEAAAGGIIRVRYRLAHTGRRMTAFALKLVEESPGGSASIDGPLMSFAVHVKPGGEVEVMGEARCTRRGELLLTGVRVFSEFPFGLVRKSVWFAQPGRVVVPPAEVEVPPLAERLLGRRGPASEETPEPKPEFQGEEFFALREYEEGDPQRLIAWRASARRDPQSQGLLVKQHAGLPPPSPRVVVSLEATKAADEPAYERAISEAASIIRLAERRGSAVGLEVIGLGHSLAPERGRRHADALIEDLALLPRFESARSHPVVATAPAASGPDVLRFLVRAGGAVEARGWSSDRGGQRLGLRGAGGRA